MTTIEGLERELKKGELHSIYLLYGEEKFLLEASVKKIKKQFGECVKGINFITIDDTNNNELISNIETPCFGYEKKLIIVKNSGLLKKDGRRKNIELEKLRNLLKDYIDKNINIINEGCIIVFIEEDVDVKCDLYKILDQNGVVCKFDFQKINQIEKRIIAICKAYNVKIDNVNVKYFVESCGTNMQELINEIRKLIEFVGPEGEISKEDIDKLSTKKLESIIFELTDNLGKKEIKKALEVFKNLIYKKEPLQKILVTLYNHFKKIYLTRIAIKNNKDIITSLDLKSNQTFLVNKYKMQARYFTDRDLREILKSLIDLDYKYKIGEIDLQVGLESILCRYCS